MEFKELDYRSPYIKKKGFALFLWCCFYKVLLDISYFWIMKENYTYYKFLCDFNGGVYALSWGIFLIITLIFVATYKRAFHKPSFLISFVLYLLSFVPFTSLMAGGYDISFGLGNGLYWLILALLVFLFNRHPKPEIIDNNEKPTTFSKAFLVICGVISIAIVFYMSLMYRGFSFNFSLDNVYDLRSEAASIYSNAPTVFVYLFTWSRTINTVLLAYCLVNKRIKTSLLFIVTQLLSFSFDGLKTTLFLMLGTIAICIVFRRMKKEKVPLFLAGILSFAILASILEYAVLHSYKITTYLSFRTLFLPNMIGSWFYDFFLTHEPDYFRSGFMRYFGFESPYSSMDIDYLISGIYFGNFQARANNGLLSDAMRNFGFAGIFIMPILIVIYFKILDKFSTRLDQRIIITLALVFGIYFSNNTFVIILVTEAGLLLLPLFYFMNRRVVLVDEGGYVLIRQNKQILDESLA